MKKLLLFLCAFLASLTVGAQPTASPSAPTIDAAKVRTVFSATYGNAVGIAGVANTKETLADQSSVIKATGGLQYSIPFAPFSVNDMEYLHYDIWANEATTIAFSMYCTSAAWIGKQENLVVGWNAIDIPLSYFTSEPYNKSLSGVITELNLCKSLVNSLDGFNNFTGTEEFYIANIYFYTTGERYDAPTISVSATDITQTSLNLNLNATKSSRATSDVITYTITWNNGANTVSPNPTGTSGVVKVVPVDGLTANTNYTFHVVATDDHGDNAEMDLNIKTLQPDGIAPTTVTIPTYNSEDVISVYSSVYTNIYDALNADNQSQFDVDNGSKHVWKLSNFRNANIHFPDNYIAPTYDKLIIDVYSEHNSTICIYPEIWANEGGGTAKGTEFNLLENTWNQCVIDVQELLARTNRASSEGVRFYTIQFTGRLVNKVDDVNASDGFDVADGSNTIYIGNVYFLKETATPTEKTIYLNPAIWNTTDNTEAYAAYVFGGGLNETWIDMTPVEDTPYYKATISSDYTGLILTRREASSSTGDFSVIWNQTNDIDFSAIANNTLFTITNWKENMDTQQGNSTYTTVPCTDPTIYTVSFKNSIGWSSVYAYTFNPETLGGWPGSQMQEDGDSYSISYKDIITPTNIIFNNGNNGEDNQTGNLIFENGKEYDLAGNSGEGSVTINAGMNKDKVLNYTWEFTQVGMDVTVTFKCTNWNEFVGIVPGGVWDRSEGANNARYDGESYTWTNCTVGQIIKAQHQWPMAEADGWTETVSYTVKESQPVKASISTYLWATFSSDKDLDFTSVSDVKAYIVTGMENGAVTTQQITGTVKAGTGMLLNSDADGSFDIPLATGEATDYSATNKMHGVTEAIETVGKADAGYTNYVLSVVDGKAAFKYVNTTSAELTKGQAYLQLEGDVQSSAPVLSIVGDGEATGISSLENNRQIKDGVYYDLSGRRVSQPTKGLYILNGKKVIIK